jgi:glyoxylase-like metal-dependent hydrolase (beta-lactamase superfamily II)
MFSKSMKILLFSILSILIFTLTTLPTDVFAAEHDQICIDKVWIESNKGKIACVTSSTAASLIERGWGTILEDSDNLQVLASMFEIHPEKMRIAAPLPETVMGPQIDFTKGYLVEEIRDGLYWVTDGAYNTMFLTTGQGVIAVDAPPSIGENYLKAIAEVTEEPVTHVIYSHTHNDHVGSISMFPDDVTLISHQEIADTLTKRNDPNRPIPTVTFEDKYTLEVGNQKLELAYYGPMHEPGNIFIYAPNQKVLMLVDVIFPGWTPFKDLALAQDVPEFIAAHDKVLEYDFDTYIGGHLTRLGTLEDVQIQKEYFQDIQTSAAKANQEISFVEIGKKVGFSNPWLVFQIYADSITQQCTDEVVPKWIDRLGGADLFTYDHCWKISESQRID